MAAKYDCEICRGRGLVRLPLYRRATVSFEATATSIEESYREYPCPECSDQAPLERVAVLDVHSMVDARIDTPEFREHAMRHAALRLVDELLKADFITLERGKTDTFRERYPVVATIGVVSKKQVATLERRIADRQDEVAKVVALEAKKQIDNWGSHYGHADILKRDAKAQVDSALNHVLSTWSAIRARLALPR
jgi:hypothetical protein